MVLVPPLTGSDTRYLRIVVRNVGNAPTTITNYSLHGFRGFRGRFRKSEFNSHRTAVITRYVGKQCPTKLDVGEEVNVMVEQDSKFDQWLKEGLWVGVHHSFGHGAQLVRIFEGGKKAKAKDQQSTSTDR